MSELKKFYAVRVSVGDAIIQPEDGQVIKSIVKSYEVTHMTPKTIVGYDKTRDWSRRVRLESFEIIKFSTVEDVNNLAFSFLTADEDRIETLTLKGLGIASNRARTKVEKASLELVHLGKAIDSILKAD